MRWLMNYIRQCFCKHDFKVEDIRDEYADDYGRIVETRYRVYMRCAKCGYHQQHAK